MWHINKTRPPEEFVEYCKTPGVSYEGLSGEPKKKLRKRLVEDQDIPVSPLDIGIENFITYFDDGSVKGCDDSGEQLVQILGLNARYLQTLRKNAIDSYLEIPMDDIKTEIEKLHVLNSGRLQPFCFAIEQCLYAILKDKEDELALVAS